MSREEPVWTVLKMLEWSTGYFTKKNVPDARLSIEWIISEVLGCKRLDLYLQFDRPLSPEELDRIRPMVKRRTLFEPLQYITGKTDFMGAEIFVNPDVLIPRQETEQLVQILFDDFAHQAGNSLTLLDLGTGSGCIPIAIKKQFPNWNCFGVDISDKALQTATSNAKHNTTDVTFFKADIALCQKSAHLREMEVDIVVSNPPYITPTERGEMHGQILDYEPEIALFHQSPLNLYKEIIGYAAQKKAPLYLECNQKTAVRVKQIAQSWFDNVELRRDLDNNPRFVIADNPISSRID